MSKFWALTISNRPHIFSLGQHDDIDKALVFAQEFAERKNKELDELFEKQKASQPDLKPFDPFDVVWIMNDGDMRQLTGEVHRPFTIAREKREVAAEALTRHGGPEPTERRETEAEAAE